MNFRTTLVLAVLVLVAVGAWLYTASRPVREEKPEAPLASETKPVFDPAIDTESIVRVQFERTGKPRLVFERSPKEDDPARLGDWRMVEPVAGPSEPGMVSSLVSAVAFLNSRAALQPGAAGSISAAEAGLEPPLATITLVDRNNKETRLEIGRKAAMSNDTYVRVAGSPTIHVASRDFGIDLKREVKDYRSRSLASFVANEAVRLRVEHEGKTYDFSRPAPDADWVINEPVRAYGDAEKLRSLLNRISGLRAADILADAPESEAAYGLTQPYLRISVTTQSKRKVPQTQPADTQPAEDRYETVTRTHELVIGDISDLKGENRYAKVVDQGGIMTVAKTSVDPLVPKLAELRDTRVTRVKAADATTLEITCGGQTATLHKMDGQWRGEGDLDQVDAAAVADLLQAFEDLRAIDYVDQPGSPEPYGLSAPRAVVTVTTTGAVAPVTLKIGGPTPSGQNTHVQVEGQASVCIVSTQQADRLALPPLALRSRTLTDAAPEHVAAIDVSRAGAVYRMEKRGEEWHMIEPPEAPVDPASIRELTNDLARLNARRVVSRGDFATYGLDRPELTIHFTLQAPPATQPAQPSAQTRPAPPEQPSTEPAAQTQPAERPVEHVLHVARREGVPYARLDERPYVYELDPTVYAVLTQELIDRRVLKFDIADLESVGVVWPGGKLELHRVGQDWKYTPDPSVSLTQSRVAELLATLSTLRAESWVAYREGDLATHGLDRPPASVALRLKGAATITLHLGPEQPDRSPRLAAWVENRAIFRLPADVAEKLLRGLDYYTQPGPPATQPQAAPFPDGGPDSQDDEE